MTDRNIPMNDHSTDDPDFEPRDKTQRWVNDIVRNHMNDQVDNLDFTVTSQLSAARRRAVAELDSTYQKRAPNFEFARLLSWQLGVGVTVLIAAITYLILPLNTSLQNPIGSSQLVSNPSSVRLIEDMQMLSGSDDLEFFQTLELLEWMDKDAV